MAMPPDAEVVVLGGGVIGIACAYELAVAGKRVTIVDRGELGGGCSAGNCGYVCPSHVLPLAGPGALLSTAKTMLSRNSALKVSPSFLLKNLGWFLGFARRCNARSMLESAVGIQALLNSSRRLYDELLCKESIECEWDARGLLFVFQSKKAHEHYAEVDALLRDRFAMPADRFDADALRALEPALKPGAAAGGWLYRGDAQLRPDLLLKQWRSVLERRGLRIVEQAEFRGFAPIHGEAQALCTTRGDFRAKAFVVATGAWAPMLNEHLGCTLPIVPGKGYSLTMPTPKTAPKYPMIFEEHRVAVSPFQSGYRIGSTMEFSGYDLTVNPKRLELLRSGAANYLPDADAAGAQNWAGLRPMVYDGNPILDRSPAFGNVWIAAGHGMLGLSTATGTGRLIAELVTGAKPHIDPMPYRLSRFD